MSEKVIMEGWEVPKENCMFQGLLKDKRIVCDAIGDDVSPEFCRYCQYLAETYKMKPYEIAERLWWKVTEVVKPKKKEAEKHG